MSYVELAFDFGFGATVGVLAALATSLIVGCGLQLAVRFFTGEVSR